MDTVIKSKAGTYHIGAQGASHCNGRSGKFTDAKFADVQSADESKFCKKCFWNGKQGALEILA